MKVWYVEFPTHRYNEDVKALAVEAGVKIIDAKFKGNNKQCKNAPKLSVKGEVKPRDNVGKTKPLTTASKKPEEKSDVMD